MPPKRSERKPLPSIKQNLKYFPVGLTEEQLAELHKARVKLKVPIAEIIRHAVFNVYLPDELGEK